MMKNSLRLKITRWVARIWSLPAILFTISEIVFPHVEDTSNVPVVEWIALGLQFLSVLGLALAWRWEGLGAGLSIVSLFFSLGILFTARGEVYYAMLAVMAGFVLLPAFLFLICWRSDRPV